MHYAYESHSTATGDRNFTLGVTASLGDELTSGCGDGPRAYWPKNAAWRVVKTNGESCADHPKLRFYVGTIRGRLGKAGAGR